jgi:1,4-dihydroxy-2-naphthoate octaprenyltransferase
VGLLATAILVVNNLRDIETDRQVGKKTLAVRLGRRGAQVEYGLLVGLSYLIPLLMWLAKASSPAVLLAWLSLPLLPPLLRLILGKKGRILNKALAGTARLELVYGVFFSAGLMLGRFL